MLCEQLRNVHLDRPVIFPFVFPIGHHGAPGQRVVYRPGYYGGFVLDPDGHNVEVVNHNRG